MTNITYSTNVSVQPILTGHLGLNVRSGEEFSGIHVRVNQWYLEGSFLGVFL